VADSVVAWPRRAAEWIDVTDAQVPYRITVGVDPGRSSGASGFPHCRQNPTKEPPLLQAILKLMAVSGAVLALSACAATMPSTPGPAKTVAPAGLGQRDLTPQEKKIIINAVAPNLKDPESAKYHWTKFSALTASDSLNYCATVDAKSPYPAYDGRQAYIVEIKVSDGQVTKATMALIAGGKDAALVAKMCAKYNLNPYNGT
jgi:hypothetical protein